MIVTVFNQEIKVCFLKFLMYQTHYYTQNYILLQLKTL